MNDESKERLGHAAILCATLCYVLTLASQCDQRDRAERARREAAGLREVWRDNTKTVEPIPGH